jgi:hypothetical protein
MNKATAKTPGISGKPSNRDFLYILFSTAAGDSGRIMAG